jgi:ankyrin repeat protein
MNRISASQSGGVSSLPGTQDNTQQLGGNGSNQAPVHNAAGSLAERLTTRVSSNFARLRRADPNHKLLNAAQANDVHAAQQALRDGADVNHPSRWRGHTPLTRAAKHDSTEVAQTLMARGDVDVNKANINTGESPLHYAVANRNVDLVRGLVAGGADTQATSYFGSGETPRELAARLVRPNTPRGQEISGIVEGRVPPEPPPPY